jgi:bifunctional non-homologous end joining protein LigD
MLADRGLPGGDLTGWAAEPKLDGWRAIVVVDPARAEPVAVRTRRGHSITASVPGMAALAALGRRVLLDGELVAGAWTAGDFYGLLPHLVGRRHPGPPAPVSFWAFDVLWLDDAALLDRPYLERRERLEELCLTGPCGVLPRFPGTDAADLLAACAANDVEGIVLKRLRSIYRPGERTRHWRKVKTPDWSTIHRPRRGHVDLAVVAGTDSGMDGDKDKLQQPDDGRPVEVREGREAQAPDEAEADIPDPSTVESVGY